MKEFIIIIFLLVIIFILILNHYSLIKVRSDLDFKHKLRHVDILRNSDITKEIKDEIKRLDKKLNLIFMKPKELNKVINSIINQSEQSVIESIIYIDALGFSWDSYNCESDELNSFDYNKSDELITCKTCGFIVSYDKFNSNEHKNNCSLFTSKLSFKSFDFPEKTLDWMISKVRPKSNYLFAATLFYKLKIIEKIKDINRKNRWFGYYQHFGEELGFWTLDEIIERVRAERDEYLNGDENK